MPVENIFSPDPAFRQRQYHKLSDNTNEWDEQIHGLLASIIPKKLGLKLTLHWQKVDDQAGYAVGSIVLNDKAKKSIGIPIIVKQWHLAPLDTMMIEDKAYPLSEDTLKEIFSGEELATEKIPRHGPSSVFDSGIMYQNTYPPVGGGRYVYSADQSLLGSVLKDAWQDDVDEFRKTAKEDSSIIAAVAKRNNEDLFKMALDAKGKKPAKKKRKASIIQVSKKAPNEYSILGNPEGVFDPVMHSVDRPTMRQFVGNVVGGGETENEFVSRIDRNREQMISAPKAVPKKEISGKPLGEHGGIFLYSENDPDNAQSCDEFGVYGVKDRAGVTSYGYVFPNVVSFDSKKMSIKIFVGRNASSVQEKFVGVREPDREMELPKTIPEYGKVGVLVYIKDGKALSTAPFRVMSSMMCGSTKSLRVKDYYGKDAKLNFSPVAEAMTKVKQSASLGHDGRIQNYVVPASMKFVELGLTKNLPESFEEHKKYASGSLDAKPLRVIRSNDKYVFRGPDLGKYANAGEVRFDFSALDKGEAQFLLGSFGCPMEKISHILRRAEGLGCEVHGLSFPKVASEVPEETGLDDFIRSLRCNLVKEASVMDEGEVVDAALSLGFVNSENVHKFVESMPRLNEAVSMLSKLLIAARLGMSNIPEAATTSAIQNILKVIEGLKKLGLMKSKKAA